MDTVEQETGVVHARPAVAIAWEVDVEGVRSAVTWRDSRPALAEVLPLFQHLGLDVVDHRHAGGSDEFVFRPRQGINVVPEALSLLAEAFVAAWEGRVDRDEFAVLVLGAGLHPGQVQLVRVAYRYLRQAGLGAGASYVCEILSSHTKFVRNWIELFEQRFDARGSMPGENELSGYANEATTRDEFRVLDWYAGLLDAVTRTNFVQSTSTGQLASLIVLKLDPSKLPFQTDPGVKVETFVHHPDVEGLHVRYGPVSRGGLRWSDRLEDYRDEVLALAKAQQVKNALIVPAGAKGAFVVKAPMAHLSREDAAAQVRRCYRTFVRGLLSVTDNLEDNRHVTAPAVVPTDGPDAYLVVAADKGTAAFSDLANAEAAEAGYWLDDAFASGGSAGFDHKRLGVTARGAWVAVRRHFIELGIDPDEDEFSVAGIGDMSGDVFGNGMLLSDNIRLVAAFDHRHVFLDPCPEPKASFHERARLAALPGSSWADYDPNLISVGGGVFPRTARSVPLSIEAREALNVDEAVLSADELVQAVLRAPVDLLWNGGIGTYVRATHEADADVADRANDRVRITAADLRCQVAGEGGNLGMSQAARIEYALNGGRVNADFIDNAAGVNTSDREVNLKILLRGVEQTRRLDRDKRDQILASCADAVVAEVLADNERQTLAISVAEGYGPAVLDRHEHVIRNLVADYGLDPEIARLPAPDDFEQRRAAGRGLTRPEIAVVLAHAKNFVHDIIRSSDIPDDPAVSGTLRAYFPAPLRDEFADRIAAHPLARDILATRLASEVIDEVGPGFLYRVEDRTGAGGDQVIRAYLIARELLGLGELWEGLNPYPVAVTMPIRQALERALEHNVTWLVRRRSRLGTLASEADQFRGPLSRLRETLSGQDLAPPGSGLSAGIEALAILGAANSVLANCSTVARMSVALPLAAAAAESGFDVIDLKATYDTVPEALGLSWLHEAVLIEPGDPHWIQLAKAALSDELAALTTAVASDALVVGGVDAWIEQHRDGVVRARSQYAGLEGSGDIDVARLTVGVQVLRDLCHATMH